MLVRIVLAEAQDTARLRVNEVKPGDRVYKAEPKVFNLDVI